MFYNKTLRHSCCWFWLQCSNWIMQFLQFCVLALSTQYPFLTLISTGGFLPEFFWISSWIFLDFSWFFWISCVLALSTSLPCSDPNIRGCTLLMPSVGPLASSLPESPAPKTRLSYAETYKRKENHQVRNCPSPSKVKDCLWAKKTTLVVMQRVGEPI